MKFITEIISSLSSSSSSLAELLQAAQEQVYSQNDLFSARISKFWLVTLDGMLDC